LPRSGAEPYGFGRYAAANYDELIDHPVEMGSFMLAHFEAGGARRVSEEYRDLLGLASHEYFHIWNVKRIKPAAFVP